FADPPRAAADDDAGFRFVIDAAYARGDADRISRTNDGRRWLDEDQRLRLQLLSLLRRVRPIVHPHRTDLGWRDRREDPRVPEPALEPDPLLPLAKHIANELAHLTIALDDVLGAGACVDSKESRHQRAVSSTWWDCCDTLCGVAVSTATTASTYRTPGFTPTSRYVVSLIGALKSGDSRPPPASPRSTR